MSDKSDKLFAIRNLHLTASPMSRPLGDNVHLVVFTFDYWAGDAEIASLSVDVIGPEDTVERLVYDDELARKPLGLIGGAGRARWTRGFTARHPLGRYEYRFELRDNEGRESGPAVATVDLVEDDPVIAISAVEPSVVRPGGRVTIFGVGFDPAAPDTHAVTIGGRAATVLEVADDRLVVEAPDELMGGRVAILNDAGLAFSPDELEPASGAAAHGGLTWFGPMYSGALFTRAENEQCELFFLGLSGGTLDSRAIPPTHAGVDEMVVASIADVIWCTQCPDNPSGFCTFGWTVSDSAVLSVSPVLTSMVPGILAVHLEYRAHSPGRAVVTGSSGSTHTVQVVPAEVPEPVPQPPEPPRAPRGQFGRPHPGPFRGGNEGRSLGTMWEVVPGAGGAIVTAAAGHPGIAVTRVSVVGPLPSVGASPQAAIPEGITEVGVTLVANDVREPIVDVPINVAATNVVGGLTGRITTTVRVLRRSSLAVNGLLSTTLTIDFGQVPRGQSAARDLLLTVVDGGTEVRGRLTDPSGVVDVSAGGAPGSAWALQASAGAGGGSCALAGFELEPGQSCRLTIEFRPTGAAHLGLHSPTLRIGGDFRNRPIHVTLQAEALPAPTLAVHQAPGDEVNFGAIALGETRYRRLVIENAGDSGSTLTGAVRLGSGAATFVIDAGEGAFSLLAGQRTTVTLAYAPPSAGEHINWLIIESNDSAAPRKRIRLRGEHVRIRVWARVFIPSLWVRAPVYLTCYAGDNRSFHPRNGTSRLEQEVEFDLGNGAVVVPPEGRTGVTQRVYCAPPEYYQRGGALIEMDQDQAPRECLQQSVAQLSETWMVVRFAAACADPLVPGAWDIDLDLSIYVNRYTKEVRIGGAHDGYPAFEVYYSFSGGAPQTIHQYMPGPDAGVSNLFPPIDIVLPHPLLVEHSPRREDLDAGVLPGGTPPQ